MEERIILDLEDLDVEVEGRKILKGVDMRLEKGKIYALMGPNGSGKSTLAYAIMGHPRFKITSGRIVFKGEDITYLSASERAKRGIFLAFQQPLEISGITVFSFLRMISGVKDTRLSSIKFSRELKERLSFLDLEEEFLQRYLNEGFSGGEKKKSEILQMTIVNPTLAILDEIDSGLDIDALKAVSNIIIQMFNPEMSILLITHYQRLLEYIKPDNILVMIDGSIVASGDDRLLDMIEKKGYDSLKEGINNERRV